jgi:hypothetical protein
MSEWVSQHLAAIILAVIALFAGIALTIRIVNNSRKDTNKAIQKNIKAGGDVSGRDTIKKN